MNVNMKTACLVLLLALCCPTLCFAKNKQPANTPEQPVAQTSRSFSKFSVQGYLCTLRCDYVGDGSSNRYLAKPKFELFLQKDNSTWTWLCKWKNRGEATTYVCNGKYVHGTRSMKMTPYTYEWKEDAYNLSVCNDFIAHTK